MSKTTILVESTTRKRLRQIGRKNQTYDQLINESLNELIRAKRSTKQDDLLYEVESK
jgi:hypothetical protein